MLVVLRRAVEARNQKEAARWLRKARCLEGGRDSQKLPDDFIFSAP